MAFTGAERARIRSLLGWGARFHSIETRLENALDAVGNLPDDETQVRTYLTKLTALDVLIEDAQGIVGVKQTGSIVLTDDQGIGGLREEGRRYVEAIAAILGVDINVNFYGGGLRGGPLRYG